ncbi:PREDICTED: uncharacterized protein LOC105449529 [Wasmannia auropunctata]|uniref:uncharacterized protein LOC105449529 n=1 Tax=Wasmannia auropunctata TaxID=64793 RepID=UPI0005F09BF8|nr:PREDICTED: uncharacterized protein LOC105449529 [Wasmannia auropunctata]
MQIMHERDCGLACIQEPYVVPNDPRWARSIENPPMAAITWQGPRVPSAVSVLTRGHGFVVVRWERIVVVSCYFSPNREINEFRAYLQSIGNAISDHIRGPLIVMGDFNARSHLWENTHPTIRGDVLVTWAAALDLRLINEGTNPTCVRPQGTSVIDLTWTSSAVLPAIRSWELAVNEESLSDHRLIFLRLHGKRDVPVERSAHNFPKWNLKSLKPKLLRASLAVAYWPAARDDERAEVLATRLQGALKAAADLSMTRHRARRRKAVYWWNDCIADLRKECIALRRKVTRGRRRRRATILALETELARTRKMLRVAIRDAKSNAWKDLLASIDRDPWGRPYKLVMV